MRTLTSEATAAQKTNSYTPYVRVNFRSRSGATTRTYTNSSASTPHLLSVKQVEGRMGGNMTTDKVPFPISAIVRIWDPEADLADVSFIGYRCDIGWGINTTTGDEYSEGEPLFVVQQSETGTTGQVFLDLYCASLWDMCLIIWGAQSVSDPFV